MQKCGKMWETCGKQVGKCENVGKCGKSGEQWGKIGENNGKCETKMPPWVRYSVWTYITYTHTYLPTYLPTYILAYIHTYSR